MQTTTRRIPVWDPFIRAFHWSLVLAYFGAWLTAEEWGWLHDRLGYFIVALLGLRLLWGLIGSEHARFISFLKGPIATLEYLKSLASGRAKHYIGHNPAGGWMTIVLITTLLATIVTGVLMGGHEDLWEELHEGLASLSLLLIVVHILGVITASLLHSENLIRAMLTGFKLRKHTDV